MQVAPNYAADPVLYELGNGLARWRVQE
jgi:hypothetical protein